MEEDDKIDFEPIEFEPLEQPSDSQSFESVDFEQEISEPQVSATEAALRGAAQGITSGFQEELSGLAEKGISKIGELTGLQSPEVSELYETKSVEDLTEQQRLQNKAAQEDNPVIYGAGEIGGSLAQAVAPGIGALSKSTKLPGLLASGAIAGAGYSEAEDVGDLAKDVALGAGLSAGIGKGLQGIGKGIKALSGGKEIADKLAEEAEKSAVLSLKPTPSEYLKLEKSDKLNELGRELLDRNVTKPFSTSNKMAELIGDIKNKAGLKIGEFIDNYDNLLKQNPSSVTPLNLSKIVDETNLQISSLERINESAAKAVKDKLDEFVKYPNRSLNEFKQFKQGIADKAYIEGQTSGREVKEALKQFERRLDSEIVDTLDKSFAGKLPEFQKAKKDYAFGIKLEKIADKAAAKETLSSGLSPTETASIAAGLATGQGLIPLTFAAKRGVKEYGQQIKASLNNKLSKLANKSPEFLGKYTNVIQNAISRGPSSLAATNFILSQQDAEYREMLDKINEMEDLEESTEE